MKGVECPTCGAFAIVEPGGIRCLTGGHLFLDRRVLPRDHWLSGWDRRNRERQRALDQAFMRATHVEDVMIEMLDRLAGLYGLDSVGESPAEV